MCKIFTMLFMVLGFYIAHVLSSTVVFNLALFALFCLVVDITVD